MPLPFHPPAPDTARDRFRVVQRRLAELAGDPSGNPVTVATELHALLAEEELLLSANAPAWERPLRDAVPGLQAVRFTAGEPANVVLGAASFPAAAAAIARVAPSVTGLTLVWHDSLPAAVRDAVFAAPELARLEHLSLKGPWRNDGVTALAACRFLTNLAALDLSGIGLGAAGLRALLTADALPAVAELDLSANPLGFDGAVALSLINALPPNLKVLRLCDVGFHEGTIGFLSQASELAALHELWLYGNPLSAHSVGDLRNALNGVAVFADGDEQDPLPAVE